MNLSSLSVATEFLQHYAHDVRLRWTTESLEAQQAFVTSGIAGLDWLDWSSEAVALQILQAHLTSTELGFTRHYEAVLMAGPLVELMEPPVLLQHAHRHLETKGRVIGIIPCLRDNSPESSLFCEVASEILWPYYTAEELLEMIAETGLIPNREQTQFVPILEFNRTVLNDALGFKGFRRVFDQIGEQGYDPIEVGWGELRFEATLDRTKFGNGTG